MSLSINYDNWNVLLGPCSCGGGEAGESGWLLVNVKVDACEWLLGGMSNPFGSD